MAQVTTPIITDTTGQAIAAAIQTLANADITNIAPAYSASSAYAVGALCTNLNKLWICTTAIGSGGETWNSSHWTMLTMADYSNRVIITADGNTAPSDHSALWVYPES